MKSIAPNVVGDSFEVWLAFEDEYDELYDCDVASHEALTYKTTTGYRIEWYHSAVGQVTGVEFDTLAEAHDWYERNDYQNYSD